MFRVLLLLTTMFFLFSAPDAVSGNGTERSLEAANEHKNIMPVRTVELDSGTLDENSTTSSAKTNTSDTSTWNKKLVILICFMVVSALLLVLYYFVFSNRSQCCLGKQRRSRLRTMRYVVEPDQAANNGGEIAGNRDEFVEVALSSEENTSSKINSQPTVEG